MSPDYLAWQTRLISATLVSIMLRSMVIPIPVVWWPIYRVAALPTVISMDFCSDNRKRADWLAITWEGQSAPPILQAPSMAREVMSADWLATMIVALFPTPTPQQPFTVLPITPVASQALPRVRFQTAGSAVSFMSAMFSTMKGLLLEITVHCWI